MNILRSLAEVVAKALAARSEPRASQGGVVSVNDSDIDRMVGVLAHKALGSTAEEAYARLDAGELDDSPIALEIRMLDRLRREQRRPSSPPPSMQQHAAAE